MQLPNLYGGEPFDTDIIVWLDEIPPLRNETWTASRIHGSGWVIYLLENKQDETSI